MRWLLLILALTGCSSSSSTSPSQDGGADASPADTGTGTGAGIDAGASCELPATTDPYCLALACPGDGCTKSAACQNDKLAQCADAKKATSAAFQAALPACSWTTSCTDIGKQADCELDKVLAAPRTKTEDDLATHFCATCSCSTPFYDRSSPYGLTILLYSDAVLAEVDATCVTAAKCSTFLDCALGVADAHTPASPASCK